jgi:Uma2 family endonuclease
MATVTTAPPEQVSPPASLLHRFTVEQYHRLIDNGVLTTEDRVELLEGWIVDKMPHNPPHDGTVSRINRRILRLLPENWLLRVQAAITLAVSEPEPDLAVVRGPEDVYFERHPGPRDIALLIEVADSSLLEDRRDKGLIYARARIPVYWIVNLRDSCIEVYTQPTAGRAPRYRRQHDFRRGESVPLILDGKEVAQIAVKELLPPTASE